MVLSVIALGLASRWTGSYLPVVLREYAGDTLWALMVFLGFGVVFPRTPTLRLAGLALTVAYLIELSQLYRAPWIEAVRRTRLGGLILGFGFVWSDLVCYAAGVLAGAGFEFLAMRFERILKRRWQ